MNFKEIFEQISKVFASLTKRQKIVVLSSIVAVIAFLVLMSLIMRNSNGTQNEFAGYSPLFINVDPNISAQIIVQLESDKVPYKLANEGTILVPTQDVYKERIAIAGAGILPTGSNKTGFELFDTKEFGSTEVEQRVKFQRAIQGELAKTIESLEPIERAVVYVAFPKESVFTQRQTPPTASVVVKLVDQTKLDLAQIDGIKRIVAGSIANLTLENVKIISQDGSTIGEDSPALQNEQQNAQIQAQIRYKHEFESRYEAKIIDMIARFTGGTDKVTAKVSIEFDFSQTDSQQEIFDPNSVVRSEQNIEEHRVGRDKTEIGGVPGAVSNIGPVQGLDDNKPNEQYDKVVANTNYEISKQVITTKPQFATIKRITAAVVVDGKYENVRNENGENKLSYIALNDNEIAQITSLVKQAVGYNPNRGDEVSVSNFEFRVGSSIKQLSQTDIFIQKYLVPFLPILKYIFAIIILFIIYKKVIVPFMNKMLMEIKPDDELSLQDTMGLDEQEEAEDTLERFKAAKKRAEDELGINEEFNEEDLKYDVLLEKMKSIVAEKSEEVSTLLQNMIKSDSSFTSSKDF